MITFERKAFNKAATKVFEAILEEWKTAFMEESFKTLNKSLKGKESLNQGIQKFQRSVII